jgi:UDP-N-acetyl-D-mannosaminuronate dehydrogenase
MHSKFTKNIWIFHHYATLEIIRIANKHPRVNIHRCKVFVGENIG